MNISKWNSKRILFIRLDRIGDLVVTLASDEHPWLEKCEKHWFISSGLGFVTRQALPTRQASEWPRKFSWSIFWKMLGEIKRLSPDLSIAFNAPWWVNLALWLARVPLRVGPLSQWHSLFFLNKTLRQKRSDSLQHEAQYNYDLVCFALDDVNKVTAPILRLQAPPSGILQKLRLEANKYYVAHPGMGGSALNWPQKFYAEVISALCEQAQVVITGTQADEAWLTELGPLFKNHPKVSWLVGSLNTEELLEVLSGARALLAPSTGVLHLGAALGTASLGLYPPIQVQSITRWGPRGSSAKEAQSKVSSLANQGASPLTLNALVSPVQALALAPQLSCPAKFNCLKEKCQHFPCMETIPPKLVLENLFSLKGSKYD